MNEVPLYLPPISSLGVESIATAMFASSSIEDLLKIFLISLGERLHANRVAIYHLENDQEGKILVEAISPNIESIRNQIYPIAYFGIDSIQNYSCDRATILSDIEQISKTCKLPPHSLREVKAMMSAPILFDSSIGNKIWGLAIVQQCDHPRQWHPLEAEFIFETSQVLGQCLQAWESRLQSPVSSILFTDKYIRDQTSDQTIENDQEEFVARRIDLTEDLAITSAHTNPASPEIEVSSNFVLLDDEENEILDRIHIREDQTSINVAINLAMQKLYQETQTGANQNLSAFTRIDDPQIFDGVDVESITLEDVLENLIQDKTQDRVRSLQQKVNELIASLQQKLDEIAMLQIQIQELTESQKEFLQKLLDIQSEDIISTIKTQL